MPSSCPSSQADREQRRQVLPRPPSAWPPPPLHRGLILGVYFGRLHSQLCRSLTRAIAPALQRHLGGLTSAALRSELGVALAGSSALHRPWLAGAVRCIRLASLATSRRTCRRTAVGCRAIALAIFAVALAVGIAVRTCPRSRPSNALGRCRRAVPSHWRQASPDTGASHFRRICRLSLPPSKVPWLRRVGFGGRTCPRHRPSALTDAVRPGSYLGL